MGHNCRSGGAKQKHNEAATEAAAARTSDEHDAERIGRPHGARQQPPPIPGHGSERKHAPARRGFCSSWTAARSTCLPTTQTPFLTRKRNVSHQTRPHTRGRTTNQPQTPKDQLPDNTLQGRASRMGRHYKERKQVLGGVRSRVDYERKIPGTAKNAPRPQATQMEHGAQTKQHAPWTF